MLVAEFEKRSETGTAGCFAGPSQNALDNHIGCIALFVVHFRELPGPIDPPEDNEYLTALACDPRLPSRSSFGHMAYGQRYYYRLSGMNKKAIAPPSLKKEAKLPVILNREDLQEFFAAPTRS